MKASLITFVGIGVAFAAGVEEAVRAPLPEDYSVAAAPVEERRRAVSGNPIPPPTTEIPFDASIQYGRGWNHRTNSFAAHPFATYTASVLDDATAYQTVYTRRVVTSMSEFFSAMKATASFEGSGYGVTAKVEAAFEREDSYESQDALFVLNASKQLGFRGWNFAEVPSFTAAAKNILCPGYSARPEDDMECPLSTLTENNFNDRGKANLDENSEHEYMTSCGYPVILTGWTHTRDYAKGYIRNKEGDGYATVRNLTPGQNYRYRIYQYASNFAGTNAYYVNDEARGSTQQAASDEATAEGVAIAGNDGRIVFRFERQYKHVHLSGIAIAPEAIASTGESSSGTWNPTEFEQIYGTYFVQGERKATALDVFVRVSTETTASDQKVSGSLEASWSGVGKSVSGGATFSNQLKSEHSNSEFVVEASAYGVATNWLPDISSVDELDKIVNEYEAVSASGAGIALKLQRYNDLPDYIALRRSCGGDHVASQERDVTIEDMYASAAVTAKLLYDEISDGCPNDGADAVEQDAWELYGRMLDTKEDEFTEAGGSQAKDEADELWETFQEDLYGCADMSAWSGIDIYYKHTKEEFLTDNGVFEIPDYTLGTWGRGDFAIGFMWKGQDRRVAQESHRDYGALFVLSGYAGHPYYGPQAFLFENGKIEFRISGDNELECNGAMKNPSSTTERMLKFVHANGWLMVYVDNTLVCSGLSKKMAYYGYFDNTPLRFGGNHVNPNDQNLDGRISNIVLARGGDNLETIWTKSSEIVPSSSGYDVSASSLGDWGGGDFVIEFDYRGRGGDISPDGSYGALFIKSGQAGHPYTGPTAALWDNGDIYFRLRGDEPLICNAVSSPTSTTKRRLRFEYLEGDLRVIVDGQTKCTRAVTKDVDLSLFRNAPLRFGGNHVTTTKQNLNAGISNIKLQAPNFQP